jgi:hypothetical protein
MQQDHPRRTKVEKVAYRPQFGTSNARRPGTSLQEVFYRHHEAQRSMPAFR